MYVSIVYYDPASNSYAGREYTYKTELPLLPYQKVIAPTAKGDKKALVTRINIPEKEINPEWADRIKEIKEYDNEGFEET